MTELSFGEWLKRQRNGRGFTQAQLSHQIGCAVITLRKLEAEERRPSAQIVARLAEIFEIPQDEQKNFLKYARGDLSYAPGERREQTPWQAGAASPRVNLPAPVTALIGREQQLADVREYLMRAEIRLVTLIGPPGMGKTRLGIEAARQSPSDFSGGVFFVGLATLEDASLIAFTTLQALGYVENRKLSPEKQLMDGIGEKHVLLVLDNCEHMIDEVAQFASRLLSACSHLKILATSRESLHIPGEWLYTLHPLELPRHDAPLDLDAAARYPALRLFHERARAVRPDLVLTPENTGIISAICAQLDGLPLAIELVAAQMRLFSAQALLERLNEEFILSVEGMRHTPGRQISLSHAIGWSHGSLTSDEQKLFAFLSVFSGGFTLDAAQSIFSQQFKGESISNLLTSLLDKSLVQRSLDAPDEVRFTMLMPVQYFALERLRDLGSGSEARDWHMFYFLNLAEQADKEIRGPKQLLWLDRLDCEHDNLHAALKWSIESKNAEAGLRLAAGLAFFWFIRGHLSEGRAWLERALAQSDATSKALHASALGYLGTLSYSGEDTDPGRINNLLEKSLDMYQQLGDDAGMAWVLNMLGFIAIERNDRIKAKQFLSDSLVLRYRVGDPWGIAQTLQNFAPIAFQENNQIGAKQMTEETISLFRQVGDQRGVARTLVDLAELEVMDGNLSQTAALLKESLSQLFLLKDKASIASVLEYLAALAVRQGNFTRTVRLYGAAETIRELIGMPILFHAPYLRERYEQNLAIARKQLDDATFSRAWAEGSVMTLEQAMEFALEERVG